MTSKNSISFAKIFDLQASTLDLSAFEGQAEASPPRGFQTIRLNKGIGSCLAPVTAEQLEIAEDHLELDLSALHNPSPAFRLGWVNACENLKISLQNATFRTGRLPKGTKVKNRGNLELATWFGDFPLKNDVRTPIQDLEVSGGQIVVSRARIEMLKLIDVEALTIEGEEAQTIREASNEEDRIENVEQQSLRNQLEGMPMASGVSGTVKKLSMFGPCLIDASESGLKASSAKVSPESKLDGLNPVDLDYESLVGLEQVDHLSFWVNPKAKLARDDYRTQLENPKVDSGLDTAQQLIRLRMQRTYLLGLAGKKRQNGHTMSVLREAEKEVRTKISPKWSREGSLLRISQCLTGHGERILRPLAIWAFVLVVLLIFQVGTGRFFSRDPWIPWHLSRRVLLILQFGFPGVSFLDVKSVGGLLGALAKLNSVVFLGAALNATRKVARGS